MINAKRAKKAMNPQAYLRAHQGEKAFAGIPESSVRQDEGKVLKSYISTCRRTFSTVVHLNTCCDESKFAGEHTTISIGWGVEAGVAAYMPAQVHQ